MIERCRASMTRSGFSGWLVRIAAIVMTLALATPSYAEVSPDAAKGLPDRKDAMTVMVVHDTQSGCAPFCTDWIAAQGKIVPGTRAVFDRVLRSLGSRRLPIFIDSLGGSVLDAIAVGRAIRARHLDVVVTRTAFEPCASGQRCRAPLPDGSRPGHAQGIGSVCASACALILAAGEKRDAAPWTAVGIHQIIINRTQTRTERMFRVISREMDGQKVVISRTLVGERPLPSIRSTVKPSHATYENVSAYLTEMGIGPGLMPLMLATPPSSIHWVTTEEEKATSIVTDRIDGEYVAAEAARMAKAAHGNTAAASSTTVAPQSSVPEQALFIEAGSDPAKPKVSVGRVTWFLDRPAAGASDPSQIVLGAEVAVPEAGLMLSLRMTKGAVGSSDGSPVMDLTFSTLPTRPVHTIERIGVPQMRSKGEQGQIQLFTLIGSVRPLGANAFRVRLYGDPNGVSGNEALIKSRPWFDIAMLVDGGIKAKLTFEHGTSGSPLVEQALMAWRPASSQTAAPNAGPATKS